MFQLYFLVIFSIIIYKEDWEIINLQIICIFEHLDISNLIFIILCISWGIKIVYRPRVKWKFFIVSIKQHLFLEFKIICDTKLMNYETVIIASRVDTRIQMYRILSRDLIRFDLRFFFFHWISPGRVTIEDASRFRGIYRICGDKRSNRFAGLRRLR